MVKRRDPGPWWYEVLDRLMPRLDSEISDAPQWYYLRTWPKDKEEEESMPLANETTPRFNGGTSEIPQTQEELLEELRHCGYLVGCQDRREDLPSRHMALSGRHPAFQESYLRGRQDQNAQNLKVDGGG